MAQPRSTRDCGDDFIENPVKETLSDFLRGQDEEADQLFRVCLDALSERAYNDIGVGRIFWPMNLPADALFYDDIGKRILPKTHRGQHRESQQLW